MNNFNRRTFLSRAAVAGGTYMAAGHSPAVDAAAPERTREIPFVQAQTNWALPPPQAPATDNVAALPGGARLWYWDTGGSGNPIILLHAATGSGASWEYQQPALARAGYRVIGYSRRGHYKSGALDPANPGTASGDLHELIEHLRIDRFHLVATAAGGFTAFDYAVSHPQRLLSLVVANSLGGVTDEQYQAVVKQLLSPGYSQQPADFRELSPSYRAGYRPGVERWLHLHELAGSPGSFQPAANKVTWAALESLRVPTFLVTGSADLYMPPTSLREFTRHLPHSEALIIGEVGHAAHWEQPEIFNRELLRFLNKHRRRGR